MAFDESDFELFKKAQEGDKDAFDLLQKQLEPALKRFIRRLIDNNEIADDIAQEAFLSLYMNLERIDPIENLKPYLFRIARNLCYDTLKRKGRYNFTGDVSVLASGLNSQLARSEDEELSWKLILSKVRQNFERLPEHLRQAMILYCDENMSYAQIAYSTNVSEGTVKSRIHYARRYLTSMLHPDDLEILRKYTQGGQ